MKNVCGVVWLALAVGCPASEPTPSGTTPTPVPSDTAEPTPTPTAEPPPTPAAASLRLATWNVSRLDLPDQGDNPRTAADLALMATYADRLAADVVALQEVRGVAGTQTLFPAPAWSAECENRNSGQNVCVVLREDSGWSMTRNADVTALNASDPNLRQGLDLTLSRPGQEPLRVLAIHLRFGCLSGDTNAACPGWFDQLAIVEDWIDARAAAGEAFVVLGDWNRFLTADDTAWAAIDDDDPAGASLTRSIPQGTPTPCWSAVFTEFLDHIVLGQSAATWMSASEQIAYDETDFDTYSVLLSDHCPIWADLEVPAATR